MDQGLLEKKRIVKGRHSVKCGSLLCFSELALSVMVLRTVQFCFPKTEIGEKSDKLPQHKVQGKK